MRWIRDKFVIKSYSVERDALGPFVTICSLFGLWPLEEDNFSLRVRWCISSFCMIFTVLQALYDSYLNCVKIENNIDLFYPVPIGILGLSKMIFYYKYRDILRSNVESAVDDWFSEDSKNFGSIMHNFRSTYIKATKCFLIFGSGICYTCIIIVLFIEPDMTIIVKSAEDSQYGNVTTALKQRFLLPVSCTFNDTSGFLFWTVVVIQLLQLHITVGANLCCDGFFLSLAGHLCAQLEILKIKFATFPYSANETEIREKCNILIAKHTQLLKLAKQLQTAYSMIMLVQLVMNFFIWNVAGFNFLVHLKKRKMMSAMTNASILLISIFQTFVHCYVSDRLTSQGEDIAQSVYHCRWYLMPTSVSKNLNLIMARSRRPIGLTAGNFLQMTLSTFTSILKTAVSYLSFLHIIIKDI